MSILDRQYLKETRHYTIGEAVTIDLSLRDRSAVRLMVTTDVLALEGTNYENRKFPVPDGFYGYLSELQGSAVWKTHPLSSQLQRVVDINNVPLWQYYSDLETLEISLEAVVETSREVIRRLRQVMVALQAINIPSVPVKGWKVYLVAQVAIASIVVFGEEIVNAIQEGEEEEYYPLPVVSNIPSALSIRPDKNALIDVHLEFWHLVPESETSENPPIDPTDPADGLPPYREPGSDPGSPPGGTGPGGVPRGQGLPSGQGGSLPVGPTGNNDAAPGENDPLGTSREWIVVTAELYEPDGSVSTATTNLEPFSVPYPLPLTTGLGGPTYESSIIGPYTHGVYVYDADGLLQGVAFPTSGVAGPGEAVPYSGE